MPETACPRCGSALMLSAGGVCPQCGPAPSGGPARPPADREWARFSRQLRQLTPRAFVTPIVIGLNVLVFVVMAANGVRVDQPDSETLVRWGADYGPLTANGEPWRLVTCTFVHIGLLHLLLNMWCLAGVGSFVERLVGNAGFALLYLASGVGGSLASVAWNPGIVSAGASGAVFGVYGALLGLTVRGQDLIPLVVLKRFRGSTLGFLVYNLAFGLTTPHIDMAAHIGGLAVGFGCGLALAHPPGDAGVAGRPARNLRLALLAVAALGLGLVGAKARVRTADYLPEAFVGFEAERNQLLQTYNGAARRAESGRAADEKLRRLVEDELLPKWRDLRRRQAAAPGATGRGAEYARQLDRYMRLVEESWGLLVRSIRDDDPDLAAQAREKMAEAGRQGERMTAEFGGGS